MDRPQFVYDPPVDGWTLDGFRFLAVTNEAAVNIRAKSLYGHTFHLLLGKPLGVNGWATWWIYA